MPVMYHAFKHNQNCVAHYLTGIYSKDTSPKKSLALLNQRNPYGPLQFLVG